MYDINKAENIGIDLSNGPDSTGFGFHVSPGVPTGKETPSESNTSNKTNEAPVYGIITGCSRLRIRSEAVVNDGNVISEIKSGTEMEIDLERSTDDWYYVYAPTGAAGFCMKEFIALKD